MRAPPLFAAARKARPWFLIPAAAGAAVSYADLYMSGSPLIAGSPHPQPESGAPRPGSEAAVVFGVPFDSTHSYKPGARFGPDAIRGAFNNIEVFHPGLGVDLESAAIRDLGNTRHTVSAGEMVDMVRRITGELAGGKAAAAGGARPGGGGGGGGGGGRSPTVVMLGGEHLVTYAAYSAMPAGIGHVVFDAHYDLRDGFADAPLSHASYLRRVVEERGGSDGIVHVGARAYASEELAFLREHDIATVSDRDIRGGRGPALLRDAVSTMDAAYVSYDLDVVDPGFAPGVGNPEAAGITPRELFDMMESLQELRVPATDIVELCPPYDTGATAALAAKIMSTMIAAGVAAG